MDACGLGKSHCWHVAFFSCGGLAKCSIFFLGPNRYLSFVGGYSGKDFGDSFLGGKVNLLRSLRSGKSLNIE